MLRPEPRAAAVNISVKLNQQAAMGDQDTDKDQGGGASNGGILPQPGGAPFDQFLQRFFQQPFSTPSPEQQIVALGSGFIIDPRRYIVTNNHVVANAEKVTVISGPNPTFRHNRRPRRQGRPRPHQNQD